MKLKIPLFVATFLLISGAAEAGRRVPASGCVFETDYSTDYIVYYGGSIGNASGGTGARARNLHCALVDDSSLPKTSTSGLYVDGYDANNDPSYGTPTAQICQSDNLGTTISCTGSYSLTPSSVTFTGVYSTLLPSAATAPLRDTTRANWYAEIVISIPQTGIYGRSFVTGYYLF